MVIVGMIEMPGMMSIVGIVGILEIMGRVFLTRHEDQ
jgi:hypothetical protein